MNELNKSRESGEMSLFAMAPEIISNSEEDKNWNRLKFSFSEYNRTYHVGINEDQPYFKIEYFRDLPSDLSEEERQRFKKETRIVGGAEQLVYVLASEHAPADTIKEEIGSDTKPTGDKIAEARKFESSIPRKIDVPELVEMLKSSRAVFYTGAGISMSGNVHGIKGLENELGIGHSAESDDFTKNCLNNPQVVLNKWSKFVESLNGQPTDAHKALSNLAVKLNAQILTENADSLQENAGIRPIRISSTWLRDNIKPEWLMQLDVVVTIGLSHDDRGFLGWYKEINPSGIIVAIDLAQPVYLGNEDYLLSGDLQQLLPLLDHSI